MKSTGGINYKACNVGSYGIASDNQWGPTGFAYNIDKSSFYSCIAGYCTDYWNFKDISLRSNGAINVNGYLLDPGDYNGWKGKYSITLNDGYYPAISIY